MLHVIYAVVYWSIEEGMSLITVVLTIPNRH